MILEGLHEKEIFTKESPVRIVFSSRENFQYPAHWHNAVELVYVINNGCNIETGTQNYSLNEGELLLVAPCEIHRFIEMKGNSRNLIIQFDPLSLNILEGFNEMLPVISFTRKVGKADESHSQIEAHIKDILKSLDGDASVPALTLYLYARILDIIVILYKNTGYSAGVNKFKSGKLTKLDKAFEFIEKNYQNDITLKDVAKACGFSEYYFSRLFKNAVDKSFSSFLNDYRIHKSEKMLVGSGISITDVAFACGFNSVTSFNRIFKQVKGLSPSAFIKMQI